MAQCVLGVELTRLLLPTHRLDRSWFLKRSLRRPAVSGMHHVLMIWIRHSTCSCHYQSSVPHAASCTDLHPQDGATNVWSFLLPPAVLQTMKQVQKALAPRGFIQKFSNSATLMFGEVSREQPSKGLLIDLIWIEKILSGGKVWEVRGETTKHRGAFGHLGCSSNCFCKGVIASCAVNCLQ